MARPLRIEYDGALYHVTSRGNDRKPIFKDDGDRELLLRTLARVNERFSSRFGARPDASRADSPRHAAYRALGLTLSASPRDVQRAFRKLAAEQHPDRFPKATPAEKAQLLSRFAQLSAAYHLLMG